MKSKNNKQTQYNEEITKNPYKGIKLFVKKDTYNQLKPIIKVTNMSHSFRIKNKVKEIYNNINFEIYENEKVAFLGPNGAGKTLTVSTLCGIYKPKEGHIEYNFDYTNSPYEKLSVQFQDLQFPNSLTPKDLIDFSIKLSGEKFDQKTIDNGIEQLGIKSILKTRMSKLSGGQQQRVNVFIAMLSKPKVLFLDEFTTGLDIAIKNRIQEYIKKYCKENKISLVIISHDIDTIQELADRIIILANKKIIVDAFKKDIEKEFGSIRNLLKKYILV